VAAAAAGAAALAVGLTPAGADVREWIGDRLDATPAPSLSRLPTGGRLLTVANDGAWVVESDGSVHGLGAYSEADWSPRGLFVAATRGRRLDALEPDGDLRWSITRPAAVGRPSWAPGDGERVAYLERGRLRVAIGDGSGDQLVARGLAALTPEWRPGPGHVISYAHGDRRLVTRDVDTRRVVWERALSRAPVDVQWTADGRRLAVLFADALAVLTRDGRVASLRDLPGGGEGVELALHPSGTKVAVVMSAAAGDRVLAYDLDLRRSPPERMFGGRGRFTGVSWSPDGRWLLVAWRDADQWIFIGSTDVRRVAAFSHVGELLDPGGEDSSGFPRPAGWCCAG